MAGKPLVIRLSIKEGHKTAGLPLRALGLPGALTNVIDNRDGTFTVTGGGVIVPDARKGGQSSITVTGGGVIAMSAQKGAKVTVSVTGGGVVQLLAAKGGQVASSITGGGRMTLTFITGRESVLHITGGGVVTITAAGPQAPQTVIEIEFDEGGAGPVAKRRRGQTEFDEWTLAMDDERIVELYALRKSR